MDFSQDLLAICIDLHNCEMTYLFNSIISRSRISLDQMMTLNKEEKSRSQLIYISSSGGVIQRFGKGDFVNLGNIHHIHMR